MKKEEKKGLFQRFIGGDKAKKGSCCGSFEIEELPDENQDQSKDPSNLKKK